MATRYRVTAPVPYVVSTIAGVAFANSVGETDNPGALAYFRRHGYLVEEIGGTKPVETDPAEKDPAETDSETDPANDGSTPPPAAATINKPAKSASKVDWVTYAVTQGMAAEEAEALTQRQLTELFADTAGGDQ